MWSKETVLDRRGNRTIRTNLTGKPKQHRVAIVPERSSRAEVPGQIAVDMYRVISDPGIDDVGLWTVIRWNGEMWDVATPPEYHHGVARHTRHWTFLIRKRPDVGPGQAVIDDGQG